MSEDATKPSSTPPPVAPAGCLLRLVWTLAGNAAIYLSLATIAATRPPLPSALDYVVGIAVIVMIAARWLDITRCGGRTIGDEPATPDHLRRYVVILIGSTAVAWSIARWIAGSFSR